MAIKINRLKKVSYNFKRCARNREIWTKQYFTVGKKRKGSVVNKNGVKTEEKKFERRVNTKYPLRHRKSGKFPEKRGKKFSTNFLLH